MTLVRYNPNKFNSIFDYGLDELFTRAFPVKYNTSSFVDVRELEDHFEISIVAPGLEKKDFNISLKDEHITISYEKSTEDNPRQFSKMAFSKSWSVPQGTKAKDISAQYEAGILTVSINKNTKSTPKTHSIKVA